MVQSHLIRTLFYGRKLSFNKPLPSLLLSRYREEMQVPAMPRKQKIVVVGAGPVGSLAALYAARRGHDVELYELRSGKSKILAYFE